MIVIYTGTPGSGKSLHTAYKIWDYLLLNKKPVIANFPINFDKMEKNIFKKKRKNFDEIKSRFFYYDNYNLSVDFLIDYALEHFIPNKESQGYLIIDECGLIFNARDWNVKDRQKWIMFFQQHRKLGFDIILISQSDRMLDKQIRYFIETEYKHRNVKNYKTFGWILSLLFGGFFISIEYWYGTRFQCSSQMFLLNKKKASIYNTFEQFKK